jgi:hypothetical protein
MAQREIQHLIVDIQSVKPHPNNVRQGDIGAISESLKAHGQFRPIVVDKRTNYILAGNHTWKAAKLLGWKQISAGFLETLNDDEALRILLADNRTTDLANYDDSGLVDLLKSLSKTPIGLEGTLFDGNALDDLCRIVEGSMHGALDALGEWNDMPAYDQENKLAAFRTTVNFRSESDADLFFKILERAKKSSFWFPKDDGLIGSNVNEHYVAEN